MDSHIVDAIIGLSVVYKALDNLWLYERWLGHQPDTRAATLIFGLFHGLGLATKIRDFEVAPVGLVQNRVAFNVGVEPATPQCTISADCRSPGGRYASCSTSGSRHPPAARSRTAPISRSSLLQPRLELVPRLLFLAP